MNSMKTIEIIKINNGVRDELEDTIIVEQPININVNRKFYTSLMCTPNETMELAIGHLHAQGIISSMKCIKSIEEKGENSWCIILKKEFEADDEGRKALVSGCAGGSIDLKFLEENKVDVIEGNCRFSAEHIFTLMKGFNTESELFKQTGGVHSCSICGNEGTIFFSEDIGRHNALDKVIGKALLNNIELEDKIIMTTGRISSDITIKAARAGIPVIVSHSAPTDMALSIAKAANITMIGFVRGKRMNIYSGENRITF